MQVGPAVSTVPIAILAALGFAVALLGLVAASDLAVAAVGTMTVLAAGLIRSADSRIA